MVTMRDVAERAGVSVTTVSHVMNATRPVSDDVARRVRQAMDDLEYQPNLLARSLRKGQSLAIGMVVPDSVNPFFAEVAHGIEDTGFAEGYTVVLCNSGGDLERELVYVSKLVERQVDGIVIVAAGLSSERICDLQDRSVPVVVVDRRLNGVAAGVDSVLVDNERGGWLATQHLLELGHRRIGCITGPFDLTPSAERVTGYRRALEEAGIAYDSTLVVRGDFQHASGFTAASQLLSLPGPPTAIFACNDLMAMGAIGAATASGRRVPDDLSIAGFDDVRLAAFTNPALTTIAQPKFEMGKLAASLLVARIKGADIEPRHYTLDVHLVVRASTGPVAREAA